MLEKNIVVFFNGESLTRKTYHFEKVLNIINQCNDNVSEIGREEQNQRNIWKAYGLIKDLVNLGFDDNFR